MTDLERELRALGKELDFPAVPDLVPSLRTRLPEIEPPGRRGPRPVAWRARRVLVLATLLLALAVATALAIPPVRDGISELLSGATVERTTAPPPRATPQDERPLLGRPSTLASASRSVAFRPLVPAALGPPDSVYLSDLAPGGVVSLAYEARPSLPRAITTGFGLVITEFRGDLAPDLLRKVVPTAGRVRRLRVADSRAVWIAGPPHSLYFRTSKGEIRESPPVVAEHVLLVAQGRVLVRLEGAMSRPDAVRIARSLGRLGTDSSAPR
jgi:hypothetical protein